MTFSLDFAFDMITSLTTLLSKVKSYMSQNDSKILGRLIFWGIGVFSRGAFFSLAKIIPEFTIMCREIGYGDKTRLGCRKLPR